MKRTKVATAWLIDTLKRQVLWSEFNVISTKGLKMKNPKGILQGFFIGWEVLNSYFFFL
jgi:hypothetical protein